MLEAAITCRAPLVATLSESEVTQLTHSVYAESHLPGSTLMRQGDWGNCMHVIVQGSCSVLALSADEFAARSRQPDWSSEPPAPLLLPDAKVPCVFVHIAHWIAARMQMKCGMLH